MAILEWLYNTGLGAYIRESLWGYPISLTVHAVGMGAVVGLMIVVDLRLMGFFRTISLQGLTRLWNVAVVAFLINLASGTLLFISDAISHSKNPAFLTKMSLITVGIVLAVVLKRRPEFGAPDTPDAQTVPGSGTRMLATISLVVWTSAIISGRLVGYALRTETLF